MFQKYHRSEFESKLDSNEGTNENRSSILQDEISTSNHPVFTPSTTIPAHWISVAQNLKTEEDQDRNPNCIPESSSHEGLKSIQRSYERTPSLGPKSRIIKCFPDTNVEHFSHYKLVNQEEHKERLKEIWHLQQEYLSFVSGNEVVSFNFFNSVIILGCFSNMLSDLLENWGSDEEFCSIHDPIYISLPPMYSQTLSLFKTFIMNGKIEGISYPEAKNLSGLIDFLGQDDRKRCPLELVPYFSSIDSKEETKIKIELNKCEDKINVNLNMEYTEDEDNKDLIVFGSGAMIVQCPDDANSAAKTEKVQVKIEGSEHNSRIDEVEKSEIKVKNDNVIIDIKDSTCIPCNLPLRHVEKSNPYESPSRQNEECNIYDTQYSDVSDVEDEDCNSYLSHLRKDEHFYPFQSPTRKNDECLIITQDTENIPYNSPLKQDEKSNPYESPPRQREECNNYESPSPLGKDVGFNAYHSPTSHDESPSRQNAESIPYNSPLRQDEQLNPYGSPPRQNEECNSYESPSPLRIFLEFNAYHSPSNHDESPSRQDAESILYNSPLRQDKKLNPYGSPPRHNEECNNYKSPSPLKADGQFDYYQDKESNYHNSPFSKDEECHPIQNPKEIHSLRSKKKTLPYSKTLGYVSNTFESRRKRIHDSTLNRPKNKYQKLDKQLSTPERIIKRRESVEVFEESNFEDIYDDIENNVSQTFQQESDECRRFSITTRRISLNFVYNENDRKVERYYQEDLETKKDKRLSPPEYYIQEDCQASTKERGSVLARLGKIESEKSGSVLSRLGKINSEMKVCSFFQMGKCAYGKNCYKLHESPNLREKTGRKKKKKKKSKAKSFNRKMLSRNNLLKLGTL